MRDVDSTADNETHEPNSNDGCKKVGNGSRSKLLNEEEENKNNL